MEWNEILSMVLQIVLVTALPPVVAALVKWLWVKGSEIAQNLKDRYPSESAIVEDIARKAVAAAEQMGLSQQIKDKKAWAMEVAERWLFERGITIDCELLSAEIEAAVFEEINRYKTGG